MNPLKFALGVFAGNFLGFLVHQKGIEVNLNKTIKAAQPPSNKKELQSFLGQINFLRRFIANLARKTLVFSLLLRLMSNKDFKSESEHQRAFDSIKEYLSKPPVLMPPTK